MFPREITSTSVWKRHGLPLYAPASPDNDQKLRRQIQNKHPGKTEEGINELVQKERSRLNLKWCFDEYFGCPLSHPTLGQIVTANIFGTVHLGYIVDITPSCIFLVSIDTLTVLPAVNLDDIYTAEHSPFFENYLHDRRVCHPQHVFDWWSRAKNEQPEEHTEFSSPNDIFWSIYTDSVSDWPVDNEAWFIHDILPQRNEFLSYNQQEIFHVSTVTVIDTDESHPIPFCHAHPLPVKLSMHSIHYSRSNHMTSDPRYNASEHVTSQDLAILRDSKFLYLKLFSSLLLTTDFITHFTKLILSSLLLICVISAMSHPVKYHVEPFSYTSASVVFLGSLFSSTFPAQPIECSLLMHDMANWDWFRTLAVP